MQPAAQPRLVRRGRGRHSVTVKDATWTRLGERAAAHGTSRSCEVDHVTEEADGNNGRFRHGVANVINPAAFDVLATAAALEEARAATRQPAALAAIDRASRHLAEVGRALADARRVLAKRD